MEILDVVVVGAGWAGLAAAKTRHQLHPEESLAVFDSAATLGGTWAKHRLYTGLKTNNMLGTYQYPDFPMDTETYGVKPGQHIPGQIVHRYLETYARHFDVYDKIRFEHKVETAEHQDNGGWILTVKDIKAGDSIKIQARRLVLATGLTSEPFLPIFQGQEDFGAPIFHAKELRNHEDTYGTAKSVTVFGGTKSAWDMVYLHATKGIRVNWVIRESGHGPSWNAPPYVTPLKKWLEKLAHVRMLTWFSPCSWGAADGYVKTRNFYHGTFIGRAIVDKFWSILGNDVITLNKYDSHSETAKLKPWSNAMFVATSIGILNYEKDFFEVIKEGLVKIHIADVERLSKQIVHLSDGTALHTDVLCCATGWKHVPPIRFLPEGITEDIGMPHTPSPNSFPYASILDQVDKEIFDKFPRLKDQPIQKVQNSKYHALLEDKGLSSNDDITPSTELTPYTLYHFIIPPSSQFLKTRDIAFVGMVVNFSHPMVSHVQSLWMNAFFDEMIPSLPRNPSPEFVSRFQHKAVLHSRFGKWRYPSGFGHSFPDFVFDAVPYLDLLLKDLGLPIYRKNGAFSEMTDPYGPEDYTTVVDEWKAKQVEPEAPWLITIYATSNKKFNSSTLFNYSISKKILGLSEEEHDALVSKRNWLTSHSIPIPQDAFETQISIPKGYYTLLATFVFAQSEAGTAVCISPDGVLLTCAHCVAEEPSELTAYTSYILLSSHGNVVSAKVVAWDLIRDLALLQIDKAERLRRPFPCARLATSPPKFNTELLCIGHPGSEDLEAEHSGVKTDYDTLVLTEGTFRGLDKNQDPQDNSDIGALKHSCWTYWGHSGAGLFDRKTGALVGVHSSWDDKTGMRRGVPLEAVVAFVKEVEASKREDFAENWRRYVWREPEPTTMLRD
ncbi:dimethylaniline monooxygenase [Fusarium tjaetaba]|uniref:Dimethylaniline monooxygenase n=1 Tax=Fusarium tjaetaba TaxID=1567544 RepID=A0A8H5SCV6_9HYPO|nr:dimethylaniline monooxygenase [Fusarium tjaetaba]KAF5648698.1 dimethylaniline monooxygenase [Fusarium tjaetaba]